MATLTHSESRRLYSWWWDSHNTPKNSKWLQENLTDMDDKVKSMIKLIEEDADSFARRAEMYYQKRPKLMKLVEEFYRAYRALAERYSHATGELRHAHRTLAKAFPDQVTLECDEGSLSKPLPDVHGDDAIWNMDGIPHKVDWEGYAVGKGLKQLPEMFGAKETIFDDEFSQLSTQNQHLQIQLLSETERAGKAEHEIQSMTKVLDEMQAEKVNVLLQYQQCLEKLSKTEFELNNAQEAVVSLHEKSSRADIEVQTLTLAVIQLEAEKNAGLAKQKECSDRILKLEEMTCQFQEDVNELSNKAIEAESQVKTLQDERSRLELEKKTVLHQFQECTGKLLYLQNILSVTGNEAAVLKQQAESAETEVVELSKSLTDLKKEKESLAFQYRCCLETITKLEKDLSIMKDDVKRLTDEVLLGTTKLKTAEEKYTLLELSNKSLQVEAGNLVKKITMKDQELSRKEKELQELQTCMQDERLRQVKVEAALKMLQDLHSESANDQMVLAQELENLLGMLKNMDLSKSGQDDEFQRMNGEDFGLSQTDFSSAVHMENKKDEIPILREIKERVEKEVLHQIGVSISLQQEISSLKMEIVGLNDSYQALVEQVEAAGLNPECLGTSITSLQDENLRLSQICEHEQMEKATLSKKLDNMEEVLKKKAVMESSLVDFHSELECSHEEVKALHGEKTTLVAEKASLLSQLQCVTENMHNLLEKNAVLENALCSAKVELEGLRVKSKGLEEICELLKNERSHLLAERGSLVLKLENVERRLEYMETKFSGLKEKYTDLQKENQTMQCQVEKLEVCLGLERQDRSSSLLLSETRLAGLENQIHLLQEENRCKNKESQEVLDKALKAQFEISVLKKFMKDMEEKNCSLIIECQKHVEASRLAEKVITELESESLQQQVEAELMLDEIERLRLGIHQLFRAVETGTTIESEENLINENVFVNHILKSIEEMASSISKHEDEKQELFVEKTVLLALLEQLESKAVEIGSLNIHLKYEFKVMAERLAGVHKEKDELLDINNQLKSALSAGHQDAAVLEAELRSLSVKQAKMQTAYNALQEDYFRANQRNECLLENFSDLNSEKYQIDQLNDALLLELLETASQSSVLRSCWEEKIDKVKLLLEDLNRQHEASSSIMREMKVLREEHDFLKAENVVLKDAVYSLEREVEGFTECNAQMNKDMLNGKENLMETEARLFDTEMKLQAAENLNLTLCTTIEEMRIDTLESQQRRENLERNISQLAEKSSTQMNEIARLNNLHNKLESELDLLRHEIEENIIREQTLNMELEDMNNEFELWEAEASTFCFDLQVSSIQEVLLKNKVQELTGACRTLENECATKTSDIEQMQGKIGLMEKEIAGLKSQLNAYVPIVSSLEEDITRLEHYVLIQKKLKAEYGQETEMWEVADHHYGDTSEIHSEDQSLISLQNLQMRVKEVGKLMKEVNKPLPPRRSTSHCKQEAEIDEIDQMKSRRSLTRMKSQHSRKKLYLNEHNGSPRLQKIRRASEVRIGTQMKDIPLDHVAAHPLLGSGERGCVGFDNQMLEHWETAVGDSRRMPYNSAGISYKARERYANVMKSFELPLTESEMEGQFTVDKLELSTRITGADQDMDDRTILEGLYSDAQKLEILQTKIRILERKLRPDRKSRKDKTMHLETVQQQLQEAEDAIAHLVDLNRQLVKNIEECPPDEMATPRLKEAVKTWRMKVVEQAQKGSERIDRLQLELQKIQYMLLELEDEKKGTQREKVTRSSRTIILRDFIYSGRKGSSKRKKGPPFVCFKHTTSINAGGS